MPLACLWPRRRFPQAAQLLLHLLSTAGSLEPRWRDSLLPSRSFARAGTGAQQLPLALPPQHLVA